MRRGIRRGEVGEERRRGLGVDEAGAGAGVGVEAFVVGVGRMDRFVVVVVGVERVVLVEGDIVDDNGCYSILAA